MNVLSVMALAGVLLCLVPCVILALECLAACLPERRQRGLGRVPETVVLVPAHDEQDCISDALRSIEAELGEDDRIVVVAHNCTDRTAMVARARGAEVVEARDEGTGGKPDALKAGLRYLDADPPEIVVIIDADCRVEQGAIRTLAMAAAAHGGPVQGDYRFAAKEGDEVGSISSLALLVKNVVRPAGLTRLGWPCLLNGSGSAYPFEQLRNAPHGEGSIAEDYQLAIDLAKRGHATIFVSAARVRSVLPEGRGSALRQRRRWEHGHLALVLRTAPALVLRGLFTLKKEQFLLGLDLMVPPLAFLTLAWILTTSLALVDWLGTGNPTSISAACAGGSLFATGVVAGLVRFTGVRSTGRMLLVAPLYVLWKVPLYLGYFAKRETRWRKTERASSPPSGAADTAGDEQGRTGS